MNSINFIRSSVIAFLISVLVSGIFLVSSVFFSDSSTVVRLCFSIASFLYLVYLLKHASASYGRVTVVSLYLMSHLIMFYWQPSLLIYCAINVGFIWLVRSVYFHANVLTVIIDFVTCLVSTILAIVVLTHSNSMFMCLWSFFLAQAFVLPLLHYFYTHYLALLDDRKQPLNRSSQRFYQAYDAAEKALREMV